MSEADRPERFELDWLALREPVDCRSRAPGLVEALTEVWRSREWSKIVDLGCGTGSNVRFLRDRLPGPREWTLVDRDADLLRRAEGAAGSDPTRCVLGDLRAEGLAEVERVDLASCSALLDLASESWLQDFVTTCAANACGVYAAMNFDGIMEWANEDPDDALVRDAVHRHQRRDKGMGPAAGPAAAGILADRLRDAGYTVRTEPSPWKLGRSDRALVRALLEGWRVAASEQCPGDAGRVDAWAARRLDWSRPGAGKVTVGHVDILAVPAPGP